MGLLCCAALEATRHQGPCPGPPELLHTMVRDARETLAAAILCRHGWCQYDEQARGGETREKKKWTSLCPMNREARVVVGGEQSNVSSLFSHPRPWRRPGPCCHEGHIWVYGPTTAGVWVDICAPCHHQRPFNIPGLGCCLGPC